MKRIGAAVIALGAIAALYFLVIDSGTKTSDVAGVDGTLDEDGQVLTGQEGAADAGSGDTGKGPVLFTSGKKQSGIGALRGQLKWFATGEPAPQLSVKVAGRGRKGESIDHLLVSDERGVFSIAETPAADNLMLLVAVETPDERTIQSVVVEPDAVTDLGVLWLGKGGLLEGKVTDVEGQPIANATVSVHQGFGSVLDAFSQLQDMFKKLDQPPESDFEAATTADGNYVIADVPPGSIVVIARAKGLEPAVVQTFKGSQDKPDRVDITMSPGFTVRGTVVDTEGRGIGDARIVTIQQRSMVTGFLARTFATTNGLGQFELVVPPGGTDNVGFMVAAHGYPSSLFELKSPSQPQRFMLVGGAEMTLRVIQDASGKPLANADIMSFVGESEQMQGDPNTLITAVTDERGEATFFARPGALQMVWVKHPKVGSQIYAKNMGPMGASITLDDPTIKPGHNKRTIKVKVGTRIFGVVKSEDGQPIPGARVRSMGGFGVGVDTLTDDSGRYECITMGAMAMGLIATAPGWTQDLSKMRSGMGKPPKPGEDVEMDIVMKRAVSVVGRILKPDGTPLAGARVRLSADDEGGFGMMRMFRQGADAVTTGNGRFLLDGIAADTKKARVMARHGNYIDTQSDPFDIGKSTMTAADLTMRAGLTVVVRVTDTRGDAVGRANLEVDTDPKESINFDPMRMMMEGDFRTTNAAGRLTLTAIPPGEITVTARSRKHAATRGTLEVTADATTPYTLEIAMRNAATVKGRVTDEEGNPVAGADVSSVERRVDDDDSTWVPEIQVETGRDGTFVIEGLPDVSLELEISKKGYRDRRVEVFGANRETVDARIRKRDKSVQREIAKVEKQIQEISQRYVQASEAERKEIMDEMIELQQKLAKLRGEAAESAAEPAAVEELEPAEADGAAPPPPPVEPDDGGEA